MNIEALKFLKQDNQRLRTENQAYQEELTGLRAAFKALTRLERGLDEVSTNTDVFLLIQEILGSALQAVDSEDGSLILLDEEAGELVFVACAGSGQNSLVGMRIPASAGIVGQVVNSRQPYLAQDVRLEPLWSPMVDERTGFRTLSLMCVPVGDSKRVLGAIEVVNKRASRLFTQEDLLLLQLAARLAGLALARAEQPGPEA